MTFWGQDPKLWHEVVLGALILSIGLVLEVLVDIWRDRIRHNGEVDAMTQVSGTFPALTKRIPKGKPKKGTR